MSVNPVSRPPAITQGYYRKNQSIQAVNLNKSQQDKQKEDQLTVHKSLVPMTGFFNFLCWFILAFGFGYISSHIIQWLIM